MLPSGILPTSSLPVFKMTKKAEAHFWSLNFWYQEILTRCNGTRTARQIADALSLRCSLATDLVLLYSSGLVEVVNG